MQKAAAILFIIIFVHGTMAAQDTIYMRAYTFIFPDTAFHTSKCYMHGNYYSCNSISKYYYEIKNDSFFYYQTSQTYNDPQNYMLVSVDAIALQDIDTTKSSIYKRHEFIDKDSCLYGIDIVNKSKVFLQRKVKCINYYREGKITRSRQWHILFDCKDKNLLEKIKSRL